MAVGNPHRLRQKVLAASQGLSPRVELDLRR
jgi:hypothetical protein